MMRFVLGRRTESRRWRGLARAAGALALASWGQATLNGEPLDRPYLRHDEITAGGTLHFVLGPDPSAWGAATPSR